MKKQDWLLLAIGDRMQPIQIQKTLFKFAKESKVPADQAYDFKPYNWGPCSFDIYDGLGKLRAEGLVASQPSGRGWNLYRLTDDGKKAEVKLRGEAPPDLAGKLDEIRNWVTERDFETLLRDVYSDYEEYATESLFLE